MLNYISGIAKEIKDKSIVVEVGAFGIQVSVPQAQKIAADTVIKLHTYLHWNQENGPTLFGFQTALERQVFLLIIDCPKIGPSIALSVLSTLSAGQFLDCITTQDEKQLSKVNGIGEKKAEQLIVQLKHKVQKLLASGSVVVESQDNFIYWQNVSDVLNSLNYSKPEIAKALQHLGEKYKNEQGTLDQLIRSALTFLSVKV